MTQRQTRKNPFHAVIKAVSRVFTFRQGKHMSNYDYYEKFRDIVSISERIGGQIGVREELVKYMLEKQGISNVDAATTAQRKEATNAARDMYLGILFLLNCDRK
jgi:hypothetical protein